MRNFLLKAMALAVFAGGASVTIAAETYPVKPIHLVVSYPPGGPADLIARSLADSASRNLNQPIIVENRAGASGNIGAAYVARAEPDGYTLLFTLDTVFTVNPSIYRNAGYDASSDLEPLSLTGKYTQLLVAHPKLGVKTFAEFVAKAKTEDLSYSSAGVGSPGHLMFELLKERTGIRGTNISYKGNAPAVQGLVSGQVEVGFLSTTGALPHIRAGKLVPLMVPGNEREASLPDVPTATELGVKNYDVNGAFVLAAPAGVPDEVRTTWENEVDRLFEQPKFLEWMQNMVLRAEAVHGQAASQWLQDSAATWGELIKARGISLD